MAEARSPSRGATPSSSVPLKREFQDDHVPSVPSPLNPNAAARPIPAQAPARAQRERKESAKKKESAAGSKRGSTPDKHLDKKLKAEQDDRPRLAMPVRYVLPLPRESHQYNIKDPMFASHEPEPYYAPSGTELKKPLDEGDKKTSTMPHYQYTRCVADPLFNHIGYYRSVDQKPYGARMSFSDSDRWLYFDEETARTVTNQKGWRMSRANVVAREGRFYYEVKILKGVPADHTPDAPASASSADGPKPHVRVGWARREAPLDAPVGFDGYSYGLTDIRMEPMHRSRPSKFLDDGTDKTAKKPKSKSKSKAAQSAAGAAAGASGTAFLANDSLREGDIVGLELQLPSLSLHRKIADGSYNPAVDTSSGLAEPAVPASPATIEDEYAAHPNVVRDRYAHFFKTGMFFECADYRASKGMEGYGDRGPFAKEAPTPNHNDPTLRCLPHSSVRVWKNGKLVGTAFRSLMAFLPPCSTIGSTNKLIWQGLDDGSAGYYPAIGVFAGGVAEVNLGPDFWFPPPDMEGTASAGKGSRQGEQAVVKSEDGGLESAAAAPVATAGDDVVMEDAAWADDSHVVSSWPDEFRNARLRGIGERWVEQIAEDVCYDIVDEVDFFVQDGGEIEINLDD